MYVVAGRHLFKFNSARSEPTSTSVNCQSDKMLGDWDEVIK